MYKKTLLSLAVASSVALTGCFEDANDNTNAGSRARHLLAASWRIIKTYYHP